MKSQLTITLLACLLLTVACGQRKDSLSTGTSAPGAVGSSPSNPVSSTIAGGNANPETPAPEALAVQKNLLAFGAGAMVVAQSSEADSLSNARRMIDEASFYWMTADGQFINQSATFELPARTTLKTLAFDNSQSTYYDHRAAKDLVVEVSDISASDGFQTILAATLKEDTDNQAFPVERELAGRFVRLTVKNNHGSAKAIVLKEIRGYGNQDPAPSLENISGTYETESYGEVHLKQEGTSITGCYKYEQGVLTGGIEGRTLTLNWTQRGNTKGFTTINFTDAGRKFLSTWWSGTQKSYDTAWKGEKKSDQVGNCDHLALDGVNAVQSQLEKTLEETGHAAIYGINFDFNSDRIRDESKPTLDKILALLKKNPSWSMQIEGHTDNIGGQTFNQDLSERRAAAVKNYLTSAGIDAARLSSTGFGFSKPVATNESEAGRAQNRRVELVKK